VQRAARNGSEHSAQHASERRRTDERAHVRERAAGALRARCGRDEETTRPASPSPPSRSRRCAPQIPGRVRPRPLVVYHVAKIANDRSRSSSTMWQTARMIDRTARSLFRTIIIRVRRATIVHPPPLPRAARARGTPPSCAPSRGSRG
jgi:hypothetical protein